MTDEFCLKIPDFHVLFRDLSLPKEGVLGIFSAPKNPTASARFEPANLGTKGQHATSMPPVPLKCLLILAYMIFLNETSNAVARTQIKFSPT